MNKSIVAIVTHSLALLADDPANNKLGRTQQLPAGFGSPPSGKLAVPSIVRPLPPVAPVGH